MMEMFFNLCCPHGSLQTQGATENLKYDQCDQGSEFLTLLNFSQLKFKQSHLASGCHIGPHSLSTTVRGHCPHPEFSLTCGYELTCIDSSWSNKRLKVRKRKVAFALAQPNVRKVQGVHIIAWKILRTFSQLLCKILRVSTRKMGQKIT